MREKIIEVAQEVGLDWLMHNWFYKDHLARFYELAQAEEREACAKACERRGMVKGGEVFAARIRARGADTQAPTDAETGPTGPT